MPISIQIYVLLLSTIATIMMSDTFFFITAARIGVRENISDRHTY